MQHHGAAGEKEVQSEIAICGDVHAVSGDGIEPELLSQGVPVDSETAASQGAGAERHHIDPATCLLKALEIASRHFEISEQVVRPEDCLRAAEVCVPGDDGLRIFVSKR